MSKKSRLYIDSDDRVGSATTLLSNAYYKSNQIMRADVKQIGLSKIHLRYNVPTINERNNRLTFLSSSSGLQHSVVLLDGYYTPLTLMQMIRDRLNTITGTSGLTFSIAQFGLVNFTLTSAGGNFKFINGDLSDSHVYRGHPCSGITEMVDFSNVIEVLAKCFYTSYVDILVPDLKIGQVRESFFSNTLYTVNPFDHLHRVHVNIDREAYDNIIIDDEIHNIHYSDIYQRRLTELNISLYDEFGDLIYDKKNTGGNYTNYISYGLEISLVS